MRRAKQHSNFDATVELLRQKPIILELSLFILILILAGYFRFVSLRLNPGWYSDEGEFIDFSSHLSRGIWQFMGISNDPLIIERPPLFLLVSALVFRIFGSDILVLRFQTAFYGLLSVAFIYLFGRKMINSRIALLGAFIMAVHPTIVTLNRVGFTYNLMMPFVLTCLYSCWMFYEKRSAAWIWAASVSAALAFSTDFLGIMAPLLVAGILLLSQRRLFLPGIAAMAGVFAIVLSPIFMAAPEKVIPTLSYIYSTRVDSQLIGIVFNEFLGFGEMIRRESWIAIAIIGLFLIPERRSKILMILLTGIELVLVLRNQVPVGRGIHYIIGIFPVLAIGIASFLTKGVPIAFTFFQDSFELLSRQIEHLLFRSWIKRLWNDFGKACIFLAVTFFIISPVIWMVFSDMAQSVYGNYMFFTGNDEMNFTPEKDITNVTNFLNENCTAKDLVVASPQIAWAIPCMGISYTTMNWYEGNGLKEVNVFSQPMNLENVSFAVLDPLATDFTILTLPTMKEHVKQIRQWPLVYQSDQLAVYRNPERK